MATHNYYYIFVFLLHASLLQLGRCQRSCVSDSVVINCTFCGLSDVPDSWNESTYITADLSRNNLSTITQLPYSPSIQNLILQHNNITDIETRAFVQLTNLKLIDLSYNLLTYTSLSPLIFQGNDNSYEYEPISVKILKISHNVIHALSPRVFEHLPNLTELYMDHNPLDTLDSNTILAITNAQRNLKLLDLSFCGLKFIPEGFLHTLNKLTTLHLDGNQFTMVPSILNEVSNNLIRLSLNDNPFENVTLPELRALEQLNVSYLDNVSVITSGSFALLPTLKVLRCNHNTALRYLEEYVFSEHQEIQEVCHRQSTVTLIMTLTLQENNVQISIGFLHR
jgi:Leucine-rich repeat (LRR) protein